MRSWSISAGRVFGVEFRIHLTFLFLLAFVWMTDSAARGQADAGRGLALVGIIFACVLLHEIAHALVARRAGVPVKSVILLPIGGITMVDESRTMAENSALRWKSEIRIEIGGPSVKILLAIICAACVHRIVTFATRVRG